MKIDHEFSCGSKKGYKLYREAERVLKWIRQHEKDKNLHIYTCPYCHFFHIGHHNDQVKRRNHV